MKIKKGFVIRTMGDQKMVVPIGEMASKIQGLISLNETAAAIWEILQDEHSEEEITDILCREYDADKKMIEECVHSFVRELAEKEILEK